MDSLRGNANFVPSMSSTMKGGDQFAVHDPTIVISTQLTSSIMQMISQISYVLWIVTNTTVQLFAAVLQETLLYCLAIVKDAGINIIGRNIHDLCSNFHYS